jgi:hypothetical protein
MPPFSLSVSVQRLLNSVKKLEDSLSAAGLPRWMARLPVWWLSWHYCRMLDDKIARTKRVCGKFQRWVPVVRGMSEQAASQLEFIDMNHSMRHDIESTKNTLLELRGYCMEVARMFEELGYTSPRLQLRQQRFVQMIAYACEAASILQQMVAEHDRRALEQLRAIQLSEQAAQQAPPRSLPA